MAAAEIRSQIAARPISLFHYVIVVMGIVIGTIVICMFLPMFGMGELAGKQG